MCEIKKILFNVSEKGNLFAKLWVDEDDITKDQDAKVVGIKSQVAYLFFQGVNSKVSLKQSKGYWNVVVPDSFTNLFENYKVAKDPTVKMVGLLLNNAFNNAFNSIEFIKMGGITHISQDEANAKCEEYLKGYISLYDVAQKYLANSKVKGLKQIGKTLEDTNAKPSDIKEANSVVMSYTTLLSREVIAKNNFVVDIEEVVEEKPKKKSKKIEDLEITDEMIPF